MDLETLRTQYRDRILQLAAQYGLTDIRVFGSVARGEAREDSDIDLLYHGLPGCKPLRFRRELSSLLSPASVDAIDDEEMHRLIAPYILKDAVPL